MTDLSNDPTVEKSALVRSIVFPSHEDRVVVGEYRPVLRYYVEEVDTTSVDRFVDVMVGWKS